MCDHCLSLVWRFVRKTVVLLVLALVLFPAAELVSAAGQDSPQGNIPAQTGGDDEATRLTPNEDGDFFVYLPLVVKRWPPIPYAVVLSPIAGPVFDAPYTLIWSADLSREVGPFLFYEIEESTAPDFGSTTVYTVPFVYSSTLALETYVMTKPTGTIAEYYYRVRAHNSWGAGEWSNVQSIQIYTRVDNFNDPRTGWRARRTSSPDIGLMQAYYIDGNLETYVRDLFDFAIFSPMYPAPATPYRIELRTKIVHKVNEVSYGIAFGGNQGAFCDVARETAMSPDGCFAHYYRINVIWAGNYLKYSVSRIDGHDDRGRGISTTLHDYYNLSSLIVDPADWQLWEVRVYADGFAIYLNGRYLVWIADTTYLKDPYYGIFSSTFEYNNAHFQHDIFYVVPIAATSQSGAEVEPVLLSVDQTPQPR